MYLLSCRYIITSVGNSNNNIQSNDTRLVSEVKCSSQSMIIIFIQNSPAKMFYFNVLSIFSNYIHV